MKKWIAAALASGSFAVVADDAVIDCDKAISTIEINHCAFIELESAQAELTQYLEASVKRHSYDPEWIESIKTTQKSWQAYMTDHCNSVYTYWREGTIRGVMTLSCKRKLTKQRTHEVWSNFLTYMDSTPPVLPEPHE